MEYGYALTTGKIGRRLYGCPDRAGYAPAELPDGRIGEFKLFPLAEATVSNIINFENGDLPEDIILGMFQTMVITGMAWQLQGAYGRIAAGLIDAKRIFRF